MNGTAVHDRHGVDRHEAEAHLDQVLRSPAFRGSRRCQDFLRYVVTETLNGHSDAIKERMIAVSVFERGADYEPSLDSIVRVKANEVRKRLAKYYEANPALELRIDLPAGAYVPVFRTDLSGPSLSTAVVESPAVPDTPAKQFPKARVAGIAAAGLLIVTLALLAWPSPHKSDLDRLWQPLMAGPQQDVLLCLPSPKILETRLDATTRTMEHYYVGVGAAQGAALFGSILGAHKQPFHIKIGSDLSFADLRRQPAILLGGFSSPWSVELTRQLRFRLRQLSGPSDRPAILDSEDPARLWVGDRAYKASDEITQDFALVSRILDSGSGQPVITAAGLTAYGTQAATEFLSDETLISQLAQKLGPGWEAKNFQVVLHSDVRGFTAGRPTMVAWHTW
jgi:hypothetical protein